MGWGSKREGAPAASDTIENVLGRSARVQGDLKADGAFRIDGAVEGSIESTSSVVIGESGSVTGDVRGRDVVVAGKVNGNITASGHLDIVSTGRIEGDIDALSVRIETGGVFHGMSRMGEKPAAAEDDAAHAHLSAIK
jgi:cytoskeletal protein CcmA (bactofilin family)